MPSLVICLFAVFTFSTQAQVRRYDRERTRADLLRIARHPPESHVVVSNNAQSDQAQRFADFFLRTIEPRLRREQSSAMSRSALRLLRDTGSQNSPEEFAGWTAQLDALNAEYSHFLTDRQFTADVEYWARLGGQLKGQLPTRARNLLAERRRQTFPEHDQSDLERADKLSLAYGDALRSVPTGARLREFFTQLNEVRRAFKAGETRFESARREQRRLYDELGPQNLGAEAVAVEGESLNQLAIVRSRLAKSKGFSTWAAFVTDRDNQGYAPEYRGADQQIQFLKNYLAALKPVLHALLNARLNQLSIPLKSDDFDLSELSLLMPPALEQLVPNFPNENITPIWERVMSESGFSDQLLAQINLDDEFRDGKNRQMAYMSPTVLPFSKQVTLDLATLTLDPGPAFDEPGFIYILQSYKGSGINDLRTAFHEGGHATEFLLKNRGRGDDVDQEEAYAYIEVASMTSESFTRDPELLAHYAKPINGLTPSLADVKRLIENSGIVDVLSTVHIAQAALFDIEIWHYDYAQPQAKSFLKRVGEIDRELEGVLGFTRLMATAVPMSYLNLYTSHHVSGNVRYVGYVFAQIAAHMLSEHFSDVLEKETGRRSWFRQPTFAKMFAEQFAGVGWKLPFPQSLEQITKKPFAAESLVHDYRNLVRDCEGWLLGNG